MFDKQSKIDPLMQFWRCENKKECKAPIHTKINEVKEIQEYAHGASAASMETAVIKANVNCRAGESQDQPSAIISSCTKNISQAAQRPLPNLDALKQIVRKRRNQMNLAPPNPVHGQCLIRHPFTCGDF